MKPIMDLICQPWLVLEGLYDAGVEFYRNRLLGKSGQEIHIDAESFVRERGDLNGILTEMRGQEETQAVAKKAFEFKEGVALVPLHGLMTKRPVMLDLCESTQGTTSVRSALMAAANDDDVHTVILYIDSPGGTVDGTPELAQTWKEVGQLKNTISYIDGMAASAAMWVAAQGKKIIASAKTAIVGSIGVVATHIDQSEAEAKEGIKVTEITAGKWKRIYSNHQPLSKEGRSVIQDHVDSIYAVFLESIAEAKGVNAQVVNDLWGQGKTFIATEALSLGLIDGIQSFPSLLGELMQREDTGETETSIKEQPMDEAKTERERIQAILSEAPKGLEELAQKLAFDPTVTLDTARAAFLSALKSQMAAELPQALPTSTIQTEKDPISSAWEASPLRRSLFGSVEEYANAMSALNAAKAAGRVEVTKKNGGE